MPTYTAASLSSCHNKTRCPSTSCPIIHRSRQCSLSAVILLIHHVFCFCTFESQLRLYVITSINPSESSAWCDALGMTWRGSSSSTDNRSQRHLNSGMVCLQSETGDMSHLWIDRSGSCKKHLCASPLHLCSWLMNMRGRCFKGSISARCSDTLPVCTHW